MIRSKRSEHAVSEVMGTILLVALGVILAAIIGSLAFGLVGSVQNPNLVGVSAVKADNSSVIVTLTSNDNANLYNMSVTINGSYRGSMVPDGMAPLPVGNTSYFSGAVTGNDHLVIVGWFADGSQQVVIDTII